MRPRRLALAAALALPALVLAGCAPGLFDPTTPTAVDEAPWAGGTPSSTPGASTPADPAPSASDADGGAEADPQPSEVGGPGSSADPSVPPSAVDDGPALVERSGFLVLALPAREGCEPLLGRIVQEPATWTVQMLVQPGSACSGGATVATYPLPGGDRPQEVVVDLGGERTTLDVP
ncbi:hypothetical protein OVA14_01380 [Agrococcus sp. SL85]|uniref:hypothetical protein n=1 Tax=Agrococcus sp. SL85 TaxID=2995141 RepID=UPI00226D366E|nr:hypothetical protein [Agrococcus sp. SL85]WAC66471.1 hypothetical protein OVA14_01380 [Agrococcus sp. SL85]